MSSQYEKGRENIEALFDWYKKNVGTRNEATTRLHLIDTLLFECLAWDKRSDAEAEERFAGKYTDYTLKCPRRVLIIEAKKEGIYFDIPSGYSNRRYRIKTLKRDVPGLGEAISQASGYCQERGTPYGAITNGHQFVCFIGSRQDGLAPEDGDAIVFDSFEAMLDDFRLLWDILSKPGVIERNLQKKLLQGDLPVLPNKLSETLTHFPGVKNRNILQTDLQILADLVFEDIVSAQELEEQFLEKCYCQSGALSQYALISKRLLAERYKALFSNGPDKPTLVPATDKKGISKDLIAESFSRRPVLLLGDAGVGKTIFFRHFIHVEAKEVFRNALVIYIDFGSKAAFTKDIQAFTIDEIKRQLQKEHGVDIRDNNFVRGIYHGEILRFSKGIYGPLKDTAPEKFQAKEIEYLQDKLADHEQHCIASLEHLTKARQQQAILFLDNADQRSDSIQQHVFIIAQSMASHWPVTVFLALRPETFYRSRKRGSLSAYHLKAFTVAPPRIDLVLEKRLSFGLDITQGNLPVTALPPGVRVDFEKVGVFLSIVRDTLQNSESVLEAVDNLSAGNVRLALEFIKRLVGSGHIDTRKILDIYSKSKSYFVGLHEFLRAIIYGDCIYYDPNISPASNVFEITTQDPKEHFLKLIILQRVASEGKRSRHHGFVKIGTLYDFLQGLGFLVNQIDNSLGALCTTKLLETAGRVLPVDGKTEEASVRITTIGAYHLHRFPYLFVYYDAISTDLLILNETIRSEIMDVSDIKDRLKRGEKILSYLEDCYSSLNPDTSGVNWKAMQTATEEDINNIKKKIGIKGQPWIRVGPS